MFKIKKNYTTLTLLLFYSFILVLLFLYKVNSVPVQVPTWDDSHHLIMGYSYFENIASHNWQGIKNVFLNSNQIYPPLYHILIAMSYYFFGVSITSALYLNSVFIPLLVFSTYSLGATIFNRKIGIMSAILTPILPMFLNLQELVFIDYLSISLFTASTAIMFKTDFFKSTKYSVLFGFIVFLELITKWPFVIPSIPIFIYYIIAFIRSKNEDRDLLLINTFYIFIFITFALVWYRFNFNYIVSGLSFFWDPNGFPQIMWNNAERWSFNNMLLYIYPYATSGEGLGIIPLIAFLTSFFIKVKKNPKSNYIVFSIIITFLALTYLNDKAPKYLGYVYPFIVIYTLGIYNQIKDSLTRNILISVFALSIIINFILAQFNFTDSKTSEYQIKILPKYDSALEKDIWPTEKIVTNVAIQLCKDNLLVLSDSRYLNPVNLKYYFRINNQRTFVESGHNVYNPSRTDFNNFEVAKRYSCILTKSGYIGIFANRVIVDKFERYIDSTKNYKEMEFKAPDESIITLYYEQN